ncbi:NUDIX domain-containing protein [Microbacterium sp. X-17]|uniref:NUDIX hydrolase n=1 Tax=Microbacterium sp. X-17 TaxID=3144404 RepID=UPI0031F59471
MTDSVVHAAGGVLWRLVDGRLRILLIHRTQYRDVTLPKGKVEPGETLVETAVRELEEETGIRVELGVPLGVSRYHLPSMREKVVQYWAAKATDEAIQQSSFVPNKEIAAVEWVSPKRALSCLSYPVDVDIVRRFLRYADDGVLDTFPLVVLRHAKAVARGEWTKDDASRPLTARGERQARAVVGPLRAFGVRRIFSSDAVRCAATVAPLAAALDRKVHLMPELSQDAWELGQSDPRTVIGKRIRASLPAVLCSHGPVLPDILNEIALATGTLRNTHLGNASSLEVGAFSVVHLSATKPGAGIVAIETHATQV